ncbi:TetR/AcrR family transcriptional regulator [Streptacidiphilus fuscans]|uniref:TetR/AcrR family transcriptional regulator n=1 Tax=Streptacidiphilus fuscans TaxID=2789292 RepID=A0A931B2G0_9ACTN|nr:TetR/AcrR family transcriptional regulator [Streptacidiphilus fuscans]MBF9069043.1 TetR/AcrR family transcriptional regulator [Streptacidiphilus fuscans]
MSAARGPYAKTSAKRKQILDAALAAYAEAGSRKVSVRDIASRVGMTDAGVLHHFGNREALLAAVLEAREAAARDAFGDARLDPEAGLRIVAANASTPGLVKLFVDVAAAAAEPEHPAHDWFTERYATIRSSLAEWVTVDAARPEGRKPTADRPAPSRVDADWVARILLAATDGLQLQWLLEPGIDMAADIAALRDVLVAGLVARQGK